MDLENLENAPKKRFRYLRSFVPRKLQPMFRGIRKRLAIPAELREPYRSVFAYTQAHAVRQENLVRLCKEVDRRGTPGVILECGVLDGGTSALMAHATTGSGRQVHMFDSWDGLPACSEADGDEARAWVGEDVGSPRRVLSVMQKLRVDLARLHFHKGWFNDTFPRAEISSIALLHIDADFYEPVKLCLERWFPIVSPGGFVQIDDYSAFVGCRKAVDEFIAKNPELKILTAGGLVRAYYIEKPHLN